MNLTDISSRVERLDQLSRGLAKEVVLWRECADPLLYLERKAYLTAIQDALSGVEGARVTLRASALRFGLFSRRFGGHHPPPSGLPTREILENAVFEVRWPWGHPGQGPAAAG
jgi:hypothetical protein